MTSRQVRELRKHKLKLQNESGSSSQDKSGDESRDDGESGSLKKAVNPYEYQMSDDDDSSDNAFNESEEQFQIELNISKGTENPSKVDAVADALTILEESSPKSGDGTKQDQVGNPEHTVSKILLFHHSSFNPSLEMSRIAATKQLAATNFTSLIGRKHGWLLPQSELLQKLEEYSAGKRWAAFDPRREIYFNMVVSDSGSDSPGFTRFNFVPNERYIASFSTLEEIISKGEFEMLHSFVLPAANPFHPSANYFLAESYMQRDQFETSYRYILHGISSFQCGLHHNWNPTSLQRTVNGTAIPCVLLDDLDPSSVAGALSVIADDLLVDWSITHQNQTQMNPHAATDRRAEALRKQEVQQALKTPALGNLLFVKLMLLYGISLLQRGCPRTSLEVFRLINTMTYGRDVSHSLLFIADASLRARGLSVFTEYVDLYMSVLKPFNGCLDSLARMSGVSQVIASHKLTEFPLISRLDFILPQFAFSLPLFFIRKLPPKAISEKSFAEALGNITAAEFWDFVSGSIKSHVYSQPVGCPAFRFDNALLSELQLDKSDTLFCHLFLLRSLYFFPAFGVTLCDYLDTPSRQVLQEFFGTSKFFKKSLDYSGILRLYEADITSATDTMLRFIQQERRDLCAAYAKQSSELWVPLLPWLKSACQALERFCIMEHLLGSIEISARTLSFDLIKPMVALAPYVHFCGMLVQYAGVRASEFDGKNPVLPDMLLNAAPECVETAPSVARRQDSAALQGLQRWWSQFRDRTGAMNLNANGMLLFLQALLPWSRIDFTGRL
eukprot:Gregarina_sp_Poly_1__10905@NODE_851_length_5972_cov_76_800339_g615_i0_p1_GENE_NODE_851_length_5972_cov_76_800339_g615_i0NODE_851_length_5972_cov_76_800339_g615_i0_p1_ORF_typecomplete_len785_score102_17Tcf25/PF04910_14/0_00066Tcf25/PF04910_14/1_9e19DUF2164/PF09932_9/0_27DNA_meth_N/PF18284_1/0_41_NODE_851_length_5972_cov_76_800339_g615_i02742628